MGDAPHHHFDLVIKALGFESVEAADFADLKCREAGSNLNASGS